MSPIYILFLWLVFVGLAPISWLPVSALLVGFYLGWTIGRRDLKLDRGEKLDR